MPVTITSSTKWGVAAQHILFAIPYVAIAWTGLWLVSHKIIVPRGDGRHPEEAWVVRTVIGCIELFMLGLYLLGFQCMGNHYLKIYALAVGLIGLVALLVVGDFHGAAVTFIVFWIPAMATLKILISVPSISEILPAQLFLGNCKAPICCVFLKPPLRHLDKISHILEITDKGITYIGHDTVLPVKHHLRLCVTDTLGSHESFNANILNQGVAFMEKAMMQAQQQEQNHGGGGAILVHCTAGCSRSPAMVLYYLVKQKQMSMEAAYRHIRRCRPVVDISVDHMVALRRVLQTESNAKTQ